MCAGFRDRQCSFDLKATLQDFKRYTDRAKAAERLKARAMGLPEEPISGAPVALEEDEPEWEAPPSAEHEGYSMAGAGKRTGRLVQCIQFVACDSGGGWRG